MLTLGVCVVGGQLVGRARVEYAHEHFGHFLANERQRPREHVHEVGQPVRMWRAVELANVHHVVLVLENGRLKSFFTVFIKLTLTKYDEMFVSSTLLL